MSRIITLLSYFEGLENNRTPFRGQIPPNFKSIDFIYSFKEALRNDYIIETVTILSNNRATMCWELSSMGKKYLKIMRKMNNNISLQVFYKN